MNQILSIQNVSKRYGKTVALQNVSFEVPAGKIVGLLGPNGSGKTTLIKIVNGLLSDYEGLAKVCGHAPGHESKTLVAYLPDRVSVPDWMLVKDTLRMFADFYADFDHERARQMLVTLKVDENKRVKQLSKGMQEKLALTLCMARKAKLYILDEPIAGVDPASREVILSTILNNYSHEGSILLSTHIISDVEALFDYVVFLKDGQIALQDDAETLRAQHGNSIDGLFREVFRC